MPVAADPKKQHIDWKDVNKAIAMRALQEIGTAKNPLGWDVIKNLVTGKVEVADGKVDIQYVVDPAVAMTASKPDVEKAKGLIMATVAQAKRFLAVLGGEDIESTEPSESGQMTVKARMQGIGKMPPEKFSFSLGNFSPEAERYYSVSSENGGHNGHKPHSR